MPKIRLNIILSDDELKEIGILAFHWAFLEEIVEMTIWFYLSTTRQKGRAQTHKLDFQHKINKLRDLANEKAGTPEEKQTISDLTAAALCVATERHRYMHGRWGHSTSGKRMLFTFRETKSPKGRGEAITYEKIEKTVDDMAKIIRDFQRFLKNQPSSAHTSQHKHL